MAFLLTITEATKKWRIVHHDENGELYVDKEGQPKPRFFPIGYNIEFHNGMTLRVNDTAHGRSFTLRDDARIPVLDFFNRPTGEYKTLERDDRKILFNGKLSQLKREYDHCNMVDLMEQGMEQAEAEHAAKRAA